MSLPTPAPIWNETALEDYGPHDLTLIIQPGWHFDGAEHAWWLHKEVLEKSSTVFVRLLKRYEGEPHTFYTLDVHLGGIGAVSKAEFDCIFTFLYNGKYDEQGHIDLHDDFPTYLRKRDRLLFHFKIYVLATIYEIEPLRDYVRDKIVHFCLYRGYDHAWASLTHLCYEEGMDLWELRDVGAEVCYKLSSRTDMDIETAAGYPELVDILGDTPDIAFWVWLKTWRQGYRADCRFCGHAVVKQCQVPLPSVESGERILCGRSLIVCGCPAGPGVSETQLAQSKEKCVQCMLESKVIRPEGEASW